MMKDDAMRKLDERKLLDGLRLSQRSAFEALLDLYEDRVYNLVRRMVGEQDACDVAQEALIEICNSVKSFRGASSLGTWVHRVAANVCLEHRRRRRILFVPIEDETISQQADHTQDPAESAINKCIMCDVNAALEALPEQQRDVVILHELQGLTYSECAEVMGCPIGTVKSRLSNAFLKLREILKGYSSEGEVAI
jgi:RNA polymerase sigma-70 factor (ECF subfamily)